MTNVRIVIGLGIIAAVCGCRTFDTERPDITQLDKRDRELQSKDVVDASQEMAQQLLRLPEMNQPTRQTVVFTNVVNQTHRPYFNFDIFAMRLKGEVAKVGRDRIMIIAQRANIEDLRNKEIEVVGGGGDDFGQGGGGGPRGAGGSVQPDWAMQGTVSDLPNKGTNYYYFDFRLQNLRTREEIPLTFEAKVAR